jgi:RNA polymerase sigma-70 factor (ECF subfamily)
VEEEALEQIGQERVRRELERLSADQRTVLLLRLFGDLTVEQVADATGKKPGAVKALQRRALAVLRQGISRLTVTF